MALIFFGTPEFAVPSLKALINEREDIAVVVTQPDRAKGRRYIPSSQPVKELALSNGIRVIQPSEIRDLDFYNEVIAIMPEFIIVVAYGKILPDKILRIPKLGCINVHASLLPKYRGAAPVQWALINGERITGVTTMLMDRGLDTGDILLQAELEIQDDSLAETLSSRLSELGARVLSKTVTGIRRGEIKPKPQVGDVSYAPPLKKSDGRIDWNRTAEELFNFVRGMYPWPSAFCYLNGERVKIIKVRLLKEDSQLADYELKKSSIKGPGRIVKASHGELIVETGRGHLLIDELQPAGKKAMSVRAFLDGIATNTILRSFS
ncbi:methionyl-tRNA formyltransferase [Thermodesulfovibrionales bacterium]|nr:methionyl-tRNA formyltransferase [Thermodesulfovibrionales bacterium]